MAIFPFSLFTRKTKEDKNNLLEEGNMRSHNVRKEYDANIINQLIDSESLLNRRIQELQFSDSNLYSDAQIDLSLVSGADTRLSRLLDNWRLATTPEISWCIDEILSELINVDINVIPGKSYERLSFKTKSIIDDEFTRFIDLFNFDSEQFSDDITRFIVEGELAYEAIISEDNPEFGIIGIRRLYADSFVAVNSPVVANGFVLNVDLDSVFNSLGMQKTNLGYGGIIGDMQGKMQSRLIYNKQTNEYETDDKHVALTFPDVAYLCFGKTNVNNSLIPYSLLDKAREPYFQLAALQQSAVIMRVTRSPERLLFNLDTHGMSDKLATEYIRKFGNALSKKKTILPDGNISQQYNPSTMLESWVFGKSSESTGTTVSTVASTANYDQMEDIHYFHNRLLNIFKIPYSRITNVEKQITINSNNLPYDETRFYKFIQSSIQEKFNNALTNLFVYHLRLKGILLEKSDISVKFSPPARYAIFLENEEIQTKLEIYTSFADRDEFNKYLLMRKYLGMSMRDIKAHIKLNSVVLDPDNEELDEDFNEFGGGRSSGFDRGGRSGGFDDFDDGGDDDFGGGDDVDDMGGDFDDSDIGGSDSDDQVEVF